MPPSCATVLLSCASRRRSEMGKPRRRKNRLQGYDYSRTGWYFITICTKGREHFFGTIVGGDVHIAPHIELSKIGKIVDHTIAAMPTVDKYVIMPNHIHVIFRIPAPGDGPMRTSAPTESIPMVVRFLKRDVTMAYGFSIWQKSFHDHIIRGEADYLRIWHYIDTNPAKWREDCYYKDGDLECPRTIKPT